MATAPSVSERKPRVFEPRTITFPASTQTAIKEWLDKQITSYLERNRRLHEVEVPKRRRIVDGKPKEKNKSWPFPNASNLVHPLAGEAVDDLAARVLQLIWLTAPLVIYRYLMASADDKEAELYSAKAKLLETFFDYVAFDPKELDLYTRENKWFVDAAGLGKAWACVAPEQRMEAVWIGYKNDPDGDFENKSLYDGPKVINLRFEDILTDPDVEVFEENDPIVRRCTLKKRKLQERTFKGFFLAEPAKEVLDNPDRYGPSQVRRRENQEKGVNDSQDTTLAEWDIYECYFSWYHNKKKFRLIAWYHLHSKTMLNCVYNFVPENQVPIIETRISVDGKGMAELLEGAQEEVSTAKNNRNNAILFGILGINRISPQNKNIDRNFTLWPGISLPFGAGEFEHFEVANPAMSAISLQNEEAMIKMAQERVGVGPAVAGSGTGGTNKKGQYGSMGTLAVMQDSNTRASHRQSDFRHSHVRLASLLTDFYGFLGLGTKGALFGLDDKKLQEALDDYVSRRVRIPMRPSTASVNKEVTKQNEIMLNQAVSAYIKETSQQMQALADPRTPPEYKKWLVKVIKAKTRLMQQIVRDFQLSDQPQEFVPDIEPEAPNAQPPRPAGNVPQGLPAVANIIQQSRQRGQPPPVAGVGGTGGGLT